jgi:hypothetical protein
MLTTVIIFNSRVLLKVHQEPQFPCHKDEESDFGLDRKGALPGDVERRGRMAYKSPCSYIFRTCTEWSYKSDPAYHLSKFMWEFNCSNNIRICSVWLTLGFNFH